MLFYQALDILNRRLRRVDLTRMRPVFRSVASGTRLQFELATANLGWGYTKLRDALRGLEVDIGRTTVASILAEAGIEPAPERIGKRIWKQFLRSHWETLYACDVFAVETLGTFGTVRFMVFFVMELRSRAVHIAGIRCRARLGGLLDFYHREAA